MRPICFVSCLAILFLGSSSLAQLPGDTVEDPIWIDSIPVEVMGNTCEFEFDYDELCPYTGMAPDVVYAYTPAEDILVDISLCDSYYDTKLIIYENTVTWGNPFACSDDWCNGPNYPPGYLSHLEDLLFTAGNTYFIVVTGYMNACGDYILQIEESLGPCGLEWPVGGISEGEPDCEDDYHDTYNDGCNSPNRDFIVLEPDYWQISVFGGGGTFLGAGNPKRDRDWYQITPRFESEIVFTCTAEYPVQIYVLDGTNGCGDIVELGAATAETCATASLSLTVPPGIIWLWVAPAVFEGVPCISNYVLTLDGYNDSSTDVQEAEPLTTRSRLSCFPNPALNSTTIRYHLNEAVRVKLTVHDIAGRRIRLLDDNHYPVGEREWGWNWRDDNGRSLPSGVYLLQMEVGGKRLTEKMLLAR